MAETDRCGLALTTTSSEAASAYRDGVELMLAAWPGAGDAFDRAIAADPGFALAHIARGRTHQIFAEAALARRCAEVARELAARASEREQSHVAAIAASIEGRPAAALAIALGHLERWPRDALVMAMPLGAFGLFAFSGRADHDRARVELCERHARHYGEDWWFLTNLGWAHTEAGNVGAGRLVTERALALRRANANGAHALAHALFEQGDWPESRRFIDEWLPTYDRRGILNGHIAWHLALIAIDEGDFDTAMKLYRDRMRPAVATGAPLNVVTDAAALLWRAQIRGAAIEHADWREVADYGARTFPAAGVHFADVHLAFVSAAVGDAAGLEARIAGLEDRLAAGRLGPGSVVPQLCRGLGAFGAGNFAEAATTLDAALADLVRIGGSRAQRELVEDTLILASLKAGRPETARRLVEERLRRRPSHRDRDWLQHAAA